MSDKEIQTMWSESLMEHLYLALKKDKEDEMILEIIGELRAKDYDDDFLIKKVKQKIGNETAVTRLQNLLEGKTTGGTPSSGGEKPLSKADQARANAAAKRRAQEKPGIVGKIKGIFGSGD